MSQSIIFNNASIRYTDQGKGDVIIFLHGFLESLDIWRDFSNNLSEKFRVVCIDLPGHGKSECIAEVHSMELMAEAVKAVMDHLQIKQCVMIGHSMGGYVTLAFASLYRQLLKGMGLFHSFASADTPEGKINRDRAIDVVKQNRQRYIHNFIPDLFAPENIAQFDKEIQQLQAKASEMPTQGVIAALAGMKERSSKLDLLLNATIPILFIIGKKDTRIPFEKTLAQAAMPMYSEVHILGNVGHMGYLEAKGKTQNAVKYFAKKCFKA